MVVGNARSVHFQAKDGHFGRTQERSHECPGGGGGGVS
jgi:hypothetical protein